MNERQIEINPVITVLVFVQFLFTVIMVICFQNVLADDVAELGVEMGNSIDAVANIPQDEKNILEHYIYQKVANDAGDVNIKKNNMSIRSDSIINKYDEEYDVNYISFVVDFPEAGRSYKVFDEWPGNDSYEYVSPNDPVNVVCYEEAECDDDGAIQKFINGTFKRHGYRMPSDSTISVLPDDAYDSESDGNAIKISYLSCDTQCECKKVESAEKTLAVNLLRDYIESYGFQLNDIKYYFDNCGGD